MHKSRYIACERLHMRGWSRKFCSCLPGGRVTIVVAVAPQQVVGTKHNTCRIVLQFIVVGLLLSKIILAFSILSQTWTWVHCRNTKREPYSTAESHKQTHIHIHMHTYVCKSYLRWLGHHWAPICYPCPHKGCTRRPADSVIVATSFTVTVYIRRLGLLGGLTLTFAPT